MAERIQLSRKKGFNLQKSSINLNGLSARKVDRTTPFGNRFGFELRGKEWAYKQHKRWIMFKPQARLRERIRTELTNYNLACWCKANEFCHADTLLVIANT